MSAKSVKKSPYQAGYDTHMRLEPDTDNPYKIGTVEYMQWLNGWCTARANHYQPFDADGCWQPQDLREIG